MCAWVGVEDKVGLSLQNHARLPGKRSVGTVRETNTRRAEIRHEESHSTLRTDNAYRRTLRFDCGTTNRNTRLVDVTTFLLATRTSLDVTRNGSLYGASFRSRSEKLAPITVVPDTWNQDDRTTVSIDSMGTFERVPRRNVSLGARADNCATIHETAFSSLIPRVSGFSFIASIRFFLQTIEEIFIEEIDFFFPRVYVRSRVFAP